MKVEKTLYSDNCLALLKKKTRERKEIPAPKQYVRKLFIDGFHLIFNF